MIWNKANVELWPKRPENKKRWLKVLLIFVLFLLLTLLLVDSRTRMYNGAQYTAGYKELISCPSGWMADELKKNGGVITPEMFHPKVEVIGYDSLNKLDGKVETIAYPWGVREIHDGVEGAMHVFPTTVLRIYLGIDQERDRISYSYPEGMAYEALCGFSSPNADYSSSAWTAFYDLSRGWNVFPNGKIYYDPPVRDSWKEIDGSRFYFDESGALQQADLPAGNYTFGEVSFTVDKEGRVTPSP